MAPDSKAQRHRGWLSLFRNDDGNVMTIFAASLVPLVLVIGSGVDVSRTYMVKTRLQQACDAGVLAGRKAVGGGSGYTTAAQARAQTLFDANYDQDYQQTFDVEFTTQSDNNGGTVDGEATATMPMALMHIIGKEQTTLNVECSASMEMSNVDVTMVLDTTGSMACPQNATAAQCNTYISSNGTTEGAGGTTSRASALRSAVGNFYDTVALAALGSTARIRYAFVPYSMTVNTGRQMRSVGAQYIDTTNTYQSRAWTANACGPSLSRYACWVYRPVAYNLNNYIAGTGTYPLGGSGANVTYNWAGCIQERDTVASSSVSYSSVSGWSPTGLQDMDIDWTPTTSENGWRPYFFQAAYYRASQANATSGTDPQDACPSQSRLPATITRPQLTTYVNNLLPNGGTYHAIGMIWGGRYASPDGPIANLVNEAPPNDAVVSRHVIFMTDGVMDTSSTGYTAWGIDRHDRRINASGNTDNAAHTTRFNAVCEAVKAKGLRVWVIAFGTGLTTSLTNCASSNSAFSAANSAQLNTAFQQIADVVGDLRITK